MNRILVESLVTAAASAVNVRTVAPHDHSFFWSASCGQDTESLMFITWRRREGCWRCWPANPPPLHLQNPNPLAAPSLQISQKCYTVTASLLFRLTVKRIPQAGPFSALSRTTKYAYRMHPAVSYHAIPQPVSLLLKLYSIICSYFKYFTLLLGIFS